MRVLARFCVPGLPCGEGCKWRDKSIMSVNDLEKVEKVSHSPKIITLRNKEWHQMVLV